MSGKLSLTFAVHNIKIQRFLVLHLVWWWWWSWARADDHGNRARKSLPSEQSGCWPQVQKRECVILVMVPMVLLVLMMLIAMVVMMKMMIVSAMLLMWDACQQSGADCSPNVQTCHLGNPADPADPADQMVVVILIMMAKRTMVNGDSRWYWWRGEASVWCWLEPQLGESRAWLGLEGGRFPSKIAKAKTMILQNSAQRKT